MHKSVNPQFRLCTVPVSHSQHHGQFAPISERDAARRSRWALQKSCAQASSIGDQEVVVIGSGIGGLSSAALLAAYGVKVDSSYETVVS